MSSARLAWCEAEVQHAYEELIRNGASAYDILTAMHEAQTRHAKQPISVHHSIPGSIESSAIYTDFDDEAWVHEMVAECFNSTYPTSPPIQSNTAQLVEAGSTSTTYAALVDSGSIADEEGSHHASSSEWESVPSSPESAQKTSKPIGHIRSRPERENLRPQNANKSKRKRSRSTRRHHDQSTNRETRERGESTAMQGRRTQLRSPTRSRNRRDTAHVRNDHNTNRSSSVVEHREGFQAKDSLERRDGSQGRLMAMMQKVARGSSQKQ